MRARLVVIRLVALVLPWMALLSTGAQTPGERVWLHAVLGLGLVAVLAGPVAPAAGRWAAAGALGVLAVLPGMVVLPRARVAALAPGIAEARPDVAALGVGLHPELVPSALAFVTLLAGYGALLRGADLDRDAARRAVAWSAVVFAAIGGLHAGLGLDRLFGVVPVRPGHGLFLAPLVNPNHHGLVLCAALPLVVDEARRVGGWRAAILGLVAAWTLVLPLWISSMGLVVVLAAQGLVAALARTAGAVRVGVIVAGATVASVAGAVVATRPEWWALSAAPRAAQVVDSLAMWRDAPWFGVGAGGYEAAFAAYRTWPVYGGFDHAHSDPVEVLATTGVVGVACTIAAVAVLPRPAWRAHLPWGLAALALCVHGVGDFPWQLPALALLGVGAVALYGGDDVVWPRPGVWVGVLAAAVVLGIVPLQRVRQAEALVADVDGITDVASLDDLARRLPTRPEPVLQRLRVAWDAEVFRDATVRFADDGLTLGRLAMRARAHDPSVATATLNRARARDPNDYRLHLVAARWARDDGRPAEAVADYAEAFRHWPREHRDLHGDVLTEVLAVDPNPGTWLLAFADAPAHWSAALAWKLLSIDRPMMAKLACEQAKALRPEIHRHPASCIAADLAMGDVDAARAELVAWTTDEPQTVGAWIGVLDLLDEHGVPGDEDDLRWWSEAALRAFALEPTHRALRRRLVATKGCTPCAHGCDGDPRDAWCDIAKAADLKQGQCVEAMARLRSSPWWDPVYARALPCR